MSAINTTTTARTIFNVKNARASKASEKALDTINVDVMNVNVRYNLESAAERVNFQSVVTGILYAVKTGRLIGGTEIELRKLTVWEFSKLVARIYNAGCKTEAQVVEYLRNN